MSLKRRNQNLKSVESEGTQGHSEGQKGIRVTNGRKEV